MGTGEIITMSIFGLLVLAGLTASIYQGAKQRRQVAAYSSSRGYTLLKFNDPRLAALLDLVSPNTDWSPHTVLLVEPPPRAIYLFGTLFNSKRSRSKASTAFACLVEHTSHRPEHPVSVFTRIPGGDFLISNRIEAGSEDFQRQFSVTGDDAASAQAALTPAVQSILLELATAPGWNLTVDIAAKAIVAQSHWALSDDEWDYLVNLARKLRAAL